MKGGLEKDGRVAAICQNKMQRVIKPRARKRLEWQRVQKADP